MQCAPYTDEEIAWIRDNYRLKISDFKTAFDAKFGTARSLQGLSAKRLSLGLRTGRLPKESSAKRIGSETIENGFIIRKIASDGRRRRDNWRPVHLIRWEELYGSIPPRTNLRCKGDKLDTDPSNWDLVSEAMTTYLNGFYGGLKYSEAPAELKPTIMGVAKLIDALRQSRQKPAEPS